MFVIYYLTWKAVDFVFGIYGNRYFENDEILWDIIKKKKMKLITTKVCIQYDAGLREKTTTCK